MEIIPCPDERCGAPAEVVDEYALPSTDGPVLHVVTYCARRHKYYQVRQ